MNTMTFKSLKGHPHNSKIIPLKSKTILKHLEKGPSNVISTYWPEAKGRRDEVEMFHILLSIAVFSY